MEKKKLLVIVGPTASGKTALALEMARRLNGEIVSADSMQIYKGMDIATAKPSLSELRTVPHHLIGFLEPSEGFSVAMFKDMATDAISDIIRRGKTPIVAGGTGLYIDALIHNITYMDNTFNPEIRLTLQRRFQTEGSENLHHELKMVDPDAAEKIHPNNALKVIRALEIYYSNGQTLTNQNALSRLMPSPYDVRMVGLYAEDRNYLYDRINRRVDLMFENGLLNEAKAFYNSDNSSTSAQAIGYKELKPYIDGQASLEVCIEKLKQATRRYAKRQLTWFRRYKDIAWIPIDQYTLTDEQAAVCKTILE